LTLREKAFSLSSMTFPFAFAMGFSVASLPGPIIVLIATETLRKGVVAGLLIVTAPILIDAIVMVPLALFLQVSIVSGGGAAGLGIVGGCFLVWLGLQSMWASAGPWNFRATDRSELTWRKKEIPSFLKGLLTHLTNPYPYIYWGSVGAGFVQQGFERGGTWGAVVFPLGFWLGAGIFNLLVVYLVARGKQMLPARLEPYLHRFSGVLLMGIGVFVAVRPWWNHL
jgi:threonine/homoserine/homoserine lactone efflux protein